MSIKAEEISKLEGISRKIREEILNLIHQTKSPHIGCCFSMVEILVALYFKILKVDPQNPENSDRDRFLLSKGHGCPALYAVLSERGFIDRNTLSSFAKDGGKLEQHPTRNLQQGIEISSGSLGHGLSLGAGMAKAAKYDKKDYRIFVFLGDGELDEGSNWEAIMFASHHKIDNLVAIVDRNFLQIFGKTSEILELEPLKEKWQSFGWAVKEINGHNFEELVNTFQSIPFQKGKPSCIIANTAKGKGVSFMENERCWHDKCPDDEEYKKALSELKS